MKLLFWIKSHIWRILTVIVPIYAGMTKLGETHSYILAILNGIGVYGIIYMGQLAYAEEIREQHEKQLDEYRDKFEWRNN